MRTYIACFVTITVCIVSLGLQASACESEEVVKDYTDGTVVITNRI